MWKVKKGVISNYNKLRILMTELIIDICYECNSSCYYCQWNKNNYDIKFKEIHLHDLLIPPESLRALNIDRIVLSGGEPTLSKHIQEVVKYYNQLELPIRIISNGILLNQNKIKLYSSLGIKEIVFSVDSLSIENNRMHSSNQSTLFNKILENLKNISVMRRDSPSIVSFLGLNVVLTSMNCNWYEIEKIISYSQINNIDQVKFQPVFDDGYLSYNAPMLNLTEKNLKDLDTIYSNFRHKKCKSNFTNNIEFWRDLKKLIEGKTLVPSKCALRNNTVLLHESLLKFCFWCQHTIYGTSSTNFSHKLINNVREKFTKNLESCVVKPYCFCLQPINHKWS